MDKVNFFEKYGTIYMENFLYSTIQNSFFIMNINVEFGAALYASSTKDQSYLMINNSLFKENHALYEGGAIFASNIQTSISKCVFKSNIAQNGGVIRYYSKNGNYIIK